jgi:DNA-binding Lrp family transcriptional regulator
LTRAELQIVADLYRDARELGIPTARHIAEQLSISESTVGKRIAAARKAGLLGAALGTKSGEVAKDSNGRKK